MMKKKYVYLLCLSAAVSACKETYVSVLKPWNSNYPDSTRTLTIESELPCMALVTDKAISLNMGMERSTEEPEYDVHYLQLETNAECLIHGIDKIEGDGSSVFILDRYNSTVFRFSQKDGSFQGKYSQRGRGPGESVYLIDFALDIPNKEICLYDGSGGKLLYYSYDGELLREEPTFYYFSHIAILGNHLVIDANKCDNDMAPGIRYSRLILAEKDQTPVYTAFSNIGNNIGYGQIRQLTTCGNDVYYTHILSDTIWQVKENGTCEARYIYKFPGRGNQFDYKDFKDMTTPMYEKIRNETSGKYACFITKDFVYAQPFNQTVNTNSVLYCVPTGHCIYDPLPPMRRWIGMSNVNFTTDTFNGTSFLKILQPHSLIASDKKHIKEFGLEYRTKHLTAKERKLLETVKQEDNPVLMIIDVKPF